MALSAVVSGFISVIILGYVKRYIDHKLEAADKEKRQVEEYQRRRSVANAQLRRAEGRLFFWMYRAIKKPPANGELEEAMAAFNKAEEQSKSIDQEIVADFELDRRS